MNLLRWLYASAMLVFIIVPVCLIAAWVWVMTKIPDRPTMDRP